MITQTTTHTMRLGGQEKPWRPADFPQMPRTTCRTAYDERSRTSAEREPARGAKPSQLAQESPREGLFLKMTIAARLRRSLAGRMSGGQRRDVPQRSDDPYRVDGGA
jgi:hypothetical protein